MHPHVIRVMLDNPLAHMSSMMTTAASRSVLRPLDALQQKSRVDPMDTRVTGQNASPSATGDPSLPPSGAFGRTQAPGVWGHKIPPPPTDAAALRAKRKARTRGTCTRGTRTDPPRGGERSRHPHHKRTKHGPRTHTNSKHTERRLAQREDDRVATANPSLNDRDDQPTANQNARTP